MNTAQIIQAEHDFLAPTYTRPPFVLNSGKGCYLEDTDGKRYLDTGAGIAVNALGYGDDSLARAMQQSAIGLIHTSNLYYNEPQIQLAQMLVKNSFADKVFFANSGTEANEAAIKFARKFQVENGNPDRKDIIAFYGSFHGRTMGALALTDSEKYQAPFRPLMPGVTFAEFNDMASVRHKISKHTAAIIIEPIQGESGIHLATTAFLQNLRQLCTDQGILLICDEVQCGLGRTGKLWAHQHASITPDLMTIAKPLAAGLPLGAVLMIDQVASAMHTSEHGTTFGGGPFVCSVALHVLQRLCDPKFLSHVQTTGEDLMTKLKQLQSPLLKEVRGMGLMIGVELTIDVGKVKKLAYEQGLILIQARDNVLRLIPPLIWGKAETEALLNRLTGLLIPELIAIEQNGRQP